MAERNFSVAVFCTSVSKIELQLMFQRFLYVCSVISWHLYLQPIWLLFSFSMTHLHEKVVSRMGVNVSWLFFCKKFVNHFEFIWLVIYWRYFRRRCMICTVLIERPTRLYFPLWLRALNVGIFYSLIGKTELKILFASLISFPQSL